MPTARDTIIYKKKNTPIVTPENIKQLQHAGHIVVESTHTAGTNSVQQLSTMTREDFGRRVEVVELGIRMFDQQAGNEKSTGKRPQRSKTGNTLHTR